ncbi:MAG: 2Fe-2S iron-sulfur cluster binding domain-containing protein [Rhodospirillaceae bacterium]
MTVHSIRLKGLSRSFPCATDERLLVAMERARLADFGRAWDATIPVGCRRGGCGVCRVRIVEGSYTTAPMSVAHVSTEEQAEGYALSCCVFPQSDLLVETAPKAAGQDNNPSKKT